MAVEDPMCWQAWQADTNAMWNWNGLYREGVAGDHEAAIPDGQLCSAGRTQDGRYAALDAVGAWQAVEKPRNFTVNVLDQALHGADYYRVYITRQGFDPLTQPLRWSDLELVTEVGRTPPQGNTLIDVDAGTRSGRHIVYTIWQASHLDQSYYFCSDVVFTG
jgi:chitin-binding protein